MLADPIERVLPSIEKFDEQFTGLMNGGNECCWLPNYIGERKVDDFTTNELLDTSKFLKQKLLSGPNFYNIDIFKCQPDPTMLDAYI